MADVFIERTPFEEKHGGERDTETDAEIGAMYLQLRSQSLPANHQKIEEQGSLLLWVFREHGYANTSIFNLGFQSGVTFKFLVFQVT